MDKSLGFWPRKDKKKKKKKIRPMGEQPPLRGETNNIMSIVISLGGESILLKLANSDVLRKSSLSCG